MTTDRRPNPMRPQLAGLHHTRHDGRGVQKTSGGWGEGREREARRRWLSLAFASGPALTLSTRPSQKLKTEDDKIKESPEVAKIRKAVQVSERRARRERAKGASEGCEGGERRARSEQSPPPIRCSHLFTPHQALPLALPSHPVLKNPPTTEQGLCAKL